jgi:geranylgeranyl pyrophosphate synthase
MNEQPTSLPGWLNDPDPRQLLSTQLRSTGQFLLDHLQAQNLDLTLQALVMECLQAPGKLLGKPVMRGALLGQLELRTWPLLALLAAVSAAGADLASLSALSPSFWQRARAAAASAELLGTAIDLVDDIQDDDSSFVARVGVPLALNIAVVLRELAPLALSQAREFGWPDAAARAALKEMHTEMLNVWLGQYADIQLERRSGVTEDEVLKVTEQKSGSMVALVYKLGAFAGIGEGQKRPAAYFEMCSRFTHSLGVWMQLINDIHDAMPDQTNTRKSDRERNKKTLPLLLEAQGMIMVAPNGERAALNTQASLAYVTVFAETIRERSKNVLEELEAKFGPHPFLWPILSAIREQP